jgi:alpha,alpha-trehalase
MNDWSLVYTHYQPEQERLREALCTLGNGYFATRGAALYATADDSHYPGTYAAGCYNRLTERIAGEEIANESLVNLPNWLLLNFRICGGRWFSFDHVELLAYRQELMMRDGELRRWIRFRDPAGRDTTLEERRLVHMHERHCAAVEVQLIAENWSGELQVVSALDGNVTNAGVARYRALDGRHLEGVAAGAVDAETLYLTVRTRGSHIEIAEAARTRIYHDNQLLPATPVLEQNGDRVSHTFALHVEAGQTVRVEKTVALYTSRDHAIYEPGREATKLARTSPDYASLARMQRLVWDQLWRRFSLDMTHVDPNHDGRTEGVLRLHIFHLLQTASLATMDMDVGIPARGLHGEAYRGHVFWDELFVFPLFNLRVPEITRSLLEYRYRRLDEARRAARAEGYAGAMYPWQSGSNGREESQRLHLNPRSGRWLKDNTYLQRHVNAAIAYNVWHYFEATDDLEFLAFYGAEMMLEIARFWSSVAHFNAAGNRYEIHRVVGPDEYHDAYPDADAGGINNNAYTNVMAVWVLQRALDLAHVLPIQRWEELTALLDINREELALWEDMCRRMFVPFHDGGIISQFEGYESLQELDWQAYRATHGDIRRLDRILEAEGDSPNRYKASKQADVLMLFYLFSAEELAALFQGLGYAFEYATIPDNITYYLKRTSDGSTLSQVVHSWVLARSDREAAWGLFCDALNSDVGDIQGGTTEEGIHVGAMAGTVDLMQRCFTGIETRGGVLWLNPRLPSPLKCLRLQLHYRGHVIDLAITNSVLEVRTSPNDGRRLRIGVNGRVELLEPGTVREFALIPT